MIFDWFGFFWLSDPATASGAFVWDSGASPDSGGTKPEIINQNSINNYEPRSIALPGTINVGGGFGL